MPRTQAVRIRASAVLARATHQTFSRKWELVVEGSAARGSELSRSREKSLIPDATASSARIALRAPLRLLFYFPIPARSAGRFSSILLLSPVAWFKCDCQDQEYRVIIGVSSYCQNPLRHARLHRELAPKSTKRDG